MVSLSIVPLNAWHGLVKLYIFQQNEAQIRETREENTFLNCVLILLSEKINTYRL